MAEIIDLNGRKSKEKKRQEARSRRRAQAVAAALACGLCPRRCAHCGLPIEDPVMPPPQAPYPFCSPCLEEFQAYERRRQGNPERESYWHTEQWEDMWRTWLDAMRASDAFRSSAAFLRLMQENQD